MSIIGDLVFLLRGDPKQLNVDVNKAGDAAGASFGKRMAAGFKKSWSGQNIGKGLVQGLGLAGGLGAAGLLTGALSKITDVLGDATQAAIAEESSIQKLGTALRANVPDWNGNTDAIEKVLKARMALGFSDDEQRESLALLVVATKDETKALELQRTAMDLSRLKRISLKEASEALIKIEGGQFRALKALGIQLPKNATAEQALAAVQKAAAGQAEDYAETNEGKLLVSQVKVGEALETLGAVTMPVFVEIMTTAADIAVEFADALGGVGEAAKGNEDPLQNMANLVHDLFKDPDEQARTFTGSVFDGLNDVQSGLADFAISLNDVWTFWDSHSSRMDREAAKLADHTADSVEHLRASASADLKGVSNAIDGVTDASEELGNKVPEDNKVVAKSWDDLKRDLVSSANDIIDDAYDPIIDLDRLRANTAELAAVRVILASSKSTDAEKRDARDKLHELKKNNAEYLLALAEAGQTGDAAYAKGISELKTAIKNAKGPAKAALQEVLDKILEVERAGKVVPINIKFATIGSSLGAALKNVFGLAEGGPQQAGRPYVVGERGPEIHVPSVSGRILSTSQSIAAVSGGGGGGDTFNVHTYGMPGRAETPAETVAVWRREARVGNIKPPRAASGWKT